MLELDHLAVSAETLEEGVEYVEDLLGVRMAPGGEHGLMGTHNRLLSLGRGTYLEVIAIDPDAAEPGRARWFDLDRFSGAPRLTNWIARTDDLATAKRQAPPGIGEELALSRGDLKWRMLVPENGILPYQSCFPALIAWAGAAHPSRHLPDSGCELVGLNVSHPQASDIERCLGEHLAKGPVSFDTAPEPRLVAEIQTKAGARVLA